MVAADRVDLFSPVCKLCQKPVKQLHRLRGRHGLIVDVPRDHDAVRLLAVRDRKDLTQDIFLILDHGKRIYPLPDVEV